MEVGEESERGGGISWWLEKLPALSVLVAARVGLTSLQIIAYKIKTYESNRLPLVL
jgi:hypothetical protein